jgi:hypothetical protein
VLWAELGGLASELPQSGHTVATRSSYLPQATGYKGHVMRVAHRFWLTARSQRGAGTLACVTGAAFLLSACATSDPPVELSKPGYSCVDDSIECINRRQALLRQLQADQSRSWMKEQPTPEAYASGVRLFAMKTKKKELSCAELAQGRQEADSGPGGAKLTPAQVSRGVMFAGEVSRELGNEIGRRCSRT